MVHYDIFWLLQKKIKLGMLEMRCDGFSTLIPFMVLLELSCWVNGDYWTITRKLVLEYLRFA